MKKISIALLFVSFFVFNANSQTSFGFHAGGGLASLNSKFDGKKQDGGKHTFSFKVGGVASVGISDNISFMPELNFVRKGGKTELNETETIPGNLGTITTVVNGETNLGFIEVPLNIAYNASSEDGSGFFGGIGPVVSFGIGGKSKGSSTITTAITGFPSQTASTSFNSDVKFDGKKDATDNNDHLKAFEFGGNVFAGYKMSNGVYAKAYYNIGFSNLSPEDKTSVKTSYFGIGVGFLFGGK